MDTSGQDSTPYRCSVTIPIRYGDIDAQRHLNNVAYFTFMEQARVSYFFELGLWTADNYDALGIILAEATCSYQAPAFLGDVVKVWIRVSQLGNKSFQFDYQLETTRGVIARGKTVQVCYDYENRQTILMPEPWRRVILAYEPALDGAPAP